MTIDLTPLKFDDASILERDLEARVKELDDSRIRFEQWLATNECFFVEINNCKTR
jgi:hypothetical protein